MIPRGKWFILHSKEISFEKLCSQLKELNRKGVEEGALIEGSYKQEIPPLPYRKKAEKVLLLFPMSREESRWKTTGVPPSVLFVAGGLRKAGIKTDFSFLDVETHQLLPERRLESYSWIGITLYDELFLPVKKFLREFSRLYPEIKIAVGGPMATLAPHAVASALPEVNLIFRGEADLLFGKLLKTLSYGGDVFSIKGYLYREKKFYLLSCFHEVNYENLEQVEISFEVIPSEFSGKGLEINLSRGCPRPCLFCSHVHGKYHRQVPASKLSRWLEEFNFILKEKGINHPFARTININDDDILLDEEHFKEIIEVIAAADYRIWGIQTSIISLIERKRVKTELLDFLKEENFYVKNPLLWIGTDAFSEKRARRLQKPLINEEIVVSLVEELEKRKILNYHYWILSDAETDWGGFVKEFLFIWKLTERFKYFHLLPNSPFLIPYPYTPSYHRLVENYPERLVVAKWVKSCCDYPIVLHERPESDELYSLLHPNISLNPRIKPGEFLELLRKRDFLSAARLIHLALREEIARSEGRERARELKKVKELLEKEISRLI